MIKFDDSNSSDENLCTIDDIPDEHCAHLPIQLAKASFTTQKAPNTISRLLGLSVTTKLASDKLIDTSTSKAKMNQSQLPITSIKTPEKLIIPVNSGIKPPLSPVQRLNSGLSIPRRLDSSGSKSSLNSARFRAPLLYGKANKESPLRSLCSPKNEEINIMKDTSQ